MTLLPSEIQSADNKKSSRTIPVELLNQIHSMATCTLQAYTHSCINIAIPHDDTTQY